MPEEKLTTNQYAIAGAIFLFTYLILFVIGLARNIITNIPVIEYVLTLPNILESPMFWLAMPVFGFWSLFLIVDWVNEHFETKFGLSPFFPIIFFALALAAYMVALYWYMANVASMNQVELSLDQIDFKGRLQSSAFLLFIWAGVFGWIARYAVQKIKL